MDEIIAAQEKRLENLRNQLEQEMEAMKEEYLRKIKELQDLLNQKQKSFDALTSDHDSMFLENSEMKDQIRKSHLEQDELQMVIVN